MLRISSANLWRWCAALADLRLSSADSDPALSARASAAVPAADAADVAGDDAGLVAAASGFAYDAGFPVIVVVAASQLADQRTRAEAAALVTESGKYPGHSSTHLSL